MRLSRSKRSVSSIIAVLVVILLLSTFTASLILISEHQGNTIPRLLETSEEISQGVRENLEAKLDAVTGETVHIYVKNTGNVAAQIMEVLATKIDGSLQTVKIDPPETLISLEERVFPATIPGEYSRLGLLTERGKVYIVDTNSNSQQQPFDFTVSVDPSSGSVQQRGSVQTTVTITLKSGSSQTVTLSASGLPSGASAIFNPSSGNPTFTSTLTISAGTSTPTGTYALTAIGTDGELTRTATYALTVTSASQPFDFSVSVSPNSGSAQQGNSITSSIMVSLSSGSPQTVSLSASGLPSAASASFNPSSGNPTYTSIMTVTTSSTTPTGTYTVTVTASGGGLTRTITYALTVTSSSPPPTSYMVTFTQTGLPTGTTWSVTFGGTTRSSTDSFITFTVGSGAYSWTVSTPVSGGSGVRYAASPASGSMNVPSQTSQAITYATEYELKISVTLPEGGTTSPAPGSHWYTAGSTVLVSASVPTSFSVKVSPYNLPSGVSMTIAPSEGTPKFTATLKISAGLDATPGTYQLGTSKELVGYRFTHWTLDSNNAGSDNPITVTMNSPHELTAWVGKPNIRRSFSVTYFEMYQTETATVTETIEEAEMQYSHPLVLGLDTQDLWVKIKQIPKVRVYVKDVENYPVSGVSVMLGSQSKGTNSYGYADFYIVPGTYTLTVPSSVTIGSDSCPFYGWDDRSASRSRTVTVSGDATYTAIYKLVLHFDGSITCGWEFMLWPPAEIHYFFASLTYGTPNIGHIESTRGTRISGAAVTAYFDITVFIIERFTRSGTATTDSNGQWSVDIYAYDVLISLNGIWATASKDGYVSASWSSS